jgi:hypothetical protein
MSGMKGIWNQGKGSVPRLKMAWRGEILRFPQEDNPVLKTILDKEKRDSTILYVGEWSPF